jgi:hypothetical protein
VRTDLATATLLVALAALHSAAQPQVQVTGVRLDDAFRLVGSNSSGLVVSVTIGEPKPRATSNDFALVNFDDNGRRAGESACLAMRFLDGADPKPPWSLLDDSTGTLERSYRSLTQSHTAVAEKTRRKNLETAGRYEFVYLVGTSVKRAALVHDDDAVHRPDPKRVPVASFNVPWP